VVMVLWTVAGVYTVGYCFLFGQEAPGGEIHFVWGFPAWVFWGILVPWVVCLGFSVWFARRFMRDDHLGDESAHELEERERDV